MDFKRQLLLLTWMIAVANLVAQDSCDAAETKSKNKKYDCLTVRNHFFDCGDAVITGLLAANGGLVVAGDETINGNLVVTGTVFVDGSEVIDTNLNVVGNVCVGSIALCPAADAGTPGVPGIGGDLAYGYEYNTGAKSVAGGAALLFSNPDVSSGVTVAASSMTVSNAGLYRAQFEVRGFDATNANLFPLVFSLERNGTSFATFGSDTIATGTAVVSGAAVVALAAGDVITLHNLTNSSADTVSLATDVTGAASRNAYLILERIAA